MNGDDMATTCANSHALAHSGGELASGQSRKVLRLSRASSRSTLGHVCITTYQAGMRTRCCQASMASLAASRNQILLEMRFGRYVDIPFGY